MENLGSTAESRYTGQCEITDHDVMDLQCTTQVKVFIILQMKISKQASFETLEKNYFSQLDTCYILPVT